MSDIQALFDLDPLELTKDDARLLAAIEHYRKSRASFNIKEPKAPKPAKAPKAPKGPLDQVELDLDLLDLKPKAKPA